MLVTATIDVGARGARWRALLAPIAPLPYRRVLGYTYIGYLANNVLPARLGELYRSHALGEGEGVSRTTVLGTVVVERVVDTVMVVAIAALAVVVLSVRGVMTQRGPARARVRRRCSSSAWVSGWPPTGCRVRTGSTGSSRAGRALLELARRLREGLAVAGRPRTLVAALAFSALAWAASTGDVPGRRPGGRRRAVAGPGGPAHERRRAGHDRPVRAGLRRDVRADGRRRSPRASASRATTRSRSGLLVHLMILATTSIGGVIAMLAMRRRREESEAEAAARRPPPSSGRRRPRRATQPPEPTADA